MKVWEKIKELAKDVENFETKDHVKSWMHMTKTTPCDVETEFNIISRTDKRKLCDKNSECLNCLDEYLEIEI